MRKVLCYYRINIIFCACTYLSENETLITCVVVWNGQHCKHTTIEVNWMQGQGRVCGCAVFGIGQLAIATLPIRRHILSDTCYPATLAIQRHLLSDDISYPTTLPIRRHFLSDISYPSLDMNWQIASVPIGSVTRYEVTDSKLPIGSVAG